MDTMRLTVNGRELSAVVIVENGVPTGYASAYQVLRAYGIPARLGEAGELQIGLRAFVEAFGRRAHYDPAEDHYLIDTEHPLPALPDQPVGADVKPWLLVTPAITSNPGNRSRDLLERVIRQFRVATNPRYRQNQQGRGETYCNIFVWDVTRALGCEVPHWVDAGGQPVAPGQGRELDANGVCRWLRDHGPRHGWKPVSDWLALLEANAGRPALAVWENPGGIGHVAVVRPGTRDAARGVPIAQAGAINFDDGYLKDGFGSAEPIRFYVHD